MSCSAPCNLHTLDNQSPRAGAFDFFAPILFRKSAVDDLGLRSRSFDHTDSSATPPPACFSVPRPWAEFALNCDRPSFGAKPSLPPSPAPQRQALQTSMQIDRDATDASPRNETVASLLAERDPALRLRPHPAAPLGAMIRFFRL